MAAGTWVPGKSHREVATKHRVAEATVKDWATSASRVIRALHDGDIQELRALSLAQLQACVAKALTRRPPDLRAAVAAIAERNKVLGIISHKVDVTSRPSVAHLSREEHAAELAKLSEEIAAEQARLREEAH